jgi:hypothetical protein
MHYLSPHCTYISISEQLLIQLPKLTTCSSFLRVSNLLDFSLWQINGALFHTVHHLETLLDLIFSHCKLNCFITRHGYVIWVCKHSEVNFVAREHKHACSKLQWKFFMPEQNFIFIIKEHRVPPSIYHVKFYSMNRMSYLEVSALYYYCR